MRLFRIAFLASLGLVALGILGVAAGIVTLGIMYPAGNRALTTPPPLLSVAAGAFAAGAVAALILSAGLRSRQLAAHPRPSSTGDAAASHEARPADVSSLVAEFRPMAIGVSRGALPTSSSIPGVQRLGIYPDGLEMRTLFGRTWVDRHRIVGVHRLPGGFRVIWDDAGTRCSATISTWFGMKPIISALEKAGYRVDID